MTYGSLIDAHVHLWDLDHLPYPWVRDVPVLNRTCTLPMYDRARGDVEVDKIIFVECTVSFDDAQSRREVQWVSRLAERDERLRGIVAHASLEKGARSRDHLEWLARNPLVKGIRRLLQDEPEGFCRRPDFVEGVRLLADYGYTFDLCIRHTQLPEAIALVRACPEVRFVLDHLGKPPIRAGRLQPWKQYLRELAACPNAFCKISGVVTEADPNSWTSDDLRPYIEHAIDAFGFGRVLFGGDWPVVTTAATLTAWIEVAREMVQDCTPSERDRLFHTTAQRVYRLT